jgi:hypothetical protein
MKANLANCMWGLRQVAPDSSSAELALNEPLGSPTYILANCGGCL